MFRPVDATALDALPTAYATALRLNAAGYDEGVIAAALGVDPLSVPALLALAEAKLTAAGLSVSSRPVDVRPDRASS